MSYFSRQELLMNRDKQFPLSQEQSDNLDKLIAAMNIVRAAYGKPMVVSLIHAHSLEMGFRSLLQEESTLASLGTQNLIAQLRGDYAESILRWVFLPLYLINLLICLSKPVGDTSSKIIYWLELSTMSNNLVNRWLKSMFEKKMKRMYGEDYLHRLYSIYFPSENKTEFPLWVELDKSTKHK